MKKALLYLYVNSDQRQCFSPSPGNIILSFGEFYIEITFELNNSDEDEDLDYDDSSFNNINDFELFAEKFEGSKLLEFKISLSEYMGDRKDRVMVADNDEVYNFPFDPTSIANTTFRIVAQLFRITPNLVVDYNFNQNDPSGGFCEGEPNYNGEILLNPAILNLNIIEKTVECLGKTEYEPLGQLYYKSYFSYKSFQNDFAVEFVNTNTKVRRLGYLKLFAKFIQERQSIPLTFIDKKFEDYAQPFSTYLEDVDNSKGVIKSANGNSAKPYISLLKEFDLITSVNRVIVPTKWFRVYLNLRKDSIDNNEDIFILDNIDKLFFWEVLLRKDYLYLSIILEFLFIRELSSTQELIRSFQDLLLKRIGKLINQVPYNDKNSLNELKSMQKRVTGWKKAVIYLEHIIMPRINWIADLGIIKLDNDNRIELTDTGKRFTIEINSWIDIDAGYVGNSSKFIKTFYPHIFGVSYNQSYGTYPTKEEILSDMTFYLIKSFEQFKTLAPNRVTASQAITFAKDKIFLEKNYSVSETFFINKLESDLKDTFIYKYQSRYQDGYIQQINFK